MEGSKCKSSSHEEGEEEEDEEEEEVVEGHVVPKVPGSTSVSQNAQILSLSEADKDSMQAVSFIVCTELVPWPGMLHR